MKKKKKKTAHSSVEVAEVQMILPCSTQLVLCMIVHDCQSVHEAE